VIVSSRLSPCPSQTQHTCISALVFILFMSACFFFFFFVFDPSQYILVFFFVCVLCVSLLFSLFFFPYRHPIPTPPPTDCPRSFSVFLLLQCPPCFLFLVEIFLALCVFTPFTSRPRLRYLHPPFYPPTPHVSGFHAPRRALPPVSGGLLSLPELFPSEFVFVRHFSTEPPFPRHSHARLALGGASPPFFRCNPPPYLLPSLVGRQRLSRILSAVRPPAPRSPASSS